MGYVTPTVNSIHYERFVGKLPNLRNKVYVITGTTSGTGYCAAKALLAKGAHVIVLNRTSERADTALRSLEEEADNDGRLMSIPCDLLCFESVRNAGTAVAAAVDQFGNGLDGLVCNAGAPLQNQLQADPRHLNALLEELVTPALQRVHMQTNHLSHFLLTSMLLPSLEKAAALKGSARVVTHTSASRKTPPTPLRAKYLRQNGGNLGGDWILPRWERYHQSKLANIVFTQALKDKLQQRGINNILSLSATPGVSATQLLETTAADGESTGFNLVMKVCQSAEDGSLPLLKCVAAGDVQSGELYIPGNRGPMSFLWADGVTGWPRKRAVEGLCRDAAVKSLLWDESENAVGPFFRDGAGNSSAAKEVDSVALPI